MTIDLRLTLRRRKPQRRRTRLVPRPRSRLLNAASFAPTARAVLVPDTNVYILSAAGTLPPPVQALIERALLFHCSVCLGELALGVAHFDPRSPRWPAVRDHYVALVDAVPDTRLLIPDAAVWTDASVVAGMLARLQGFQPHQRKDCLNDALIYLTAAKAGLPVLTANGRDFDLIQQVAPEGRFITF